MLAEPTYLLVCSFSNKARKDSSSHSPKSMAQRTNSRTSLSSLRKREASAEDSVSSGKSEGGCAPRWTCFLWCGRFSSQAMVEGVQGGEPKHLKGYEHGAQAGQAGLKKTHLDAPRRNASWEVVDFEVAKGVESQRVCQKPVWTTYGSSYFFLCIAHIPRAYEHTFACSWSYSSGPELITFVGCVDGTGLDRSIGE